MEHTPQARGGRPVAFVGRAIATVAVPVALASACAGAPPAPPPVPPPPPHVQRPPPPLPAWTFWEQVEAPVVQTGPPAELPVDVTRLEGTKGAETRWTAAPQALREAIATRGFAVMRAAHPQARVGDFYAALRDDRVPWVVTLDALFFVTHLALDRAMADVDADLVAPALGTMLRRLDERLAEGSRTPPADMATAYLVARGVVAVALALVDDRYVAPPELQPLVDGERARVLTHEGVAVSPWLGVPLDYSAMAPRGQADRDEAHAGWFRAAAWLEGAALALEGMGEGPVRAQVDVQTARIHARAALLLTRLLDYDVDAEAASAWDRVERVTELLVGEPDDPSPHDVALAASALKLDIRNGAWFANVARVDRVRHEAAKARVAHVDDGSLGLVAPVAGLDPLQPIGRLAPGMRLLGPIATPDAELLQAVVFPLVGAYMGHGVAPTERDGLRALPTALDVAAWLGSGEARARVHAAGDDAYLRYDATLDRLMHARPPQESLERHRTPYLSMLDALETWLRPSQGDRVQPGASTSEWRARKAEVALAGWTELRHDAMAMSRIRVPGASLAQHPAAPVVVQAFVEPHPEAIAKLLAVVRQTERALLASGALQKTSPSIAVLEEVDDLLWTSLGVAVHEASDRAPPRELEAALAGFPARLRALEASLAASGAADVPLVVDVHADRPSDRALEEGTGRVEELWVVEREPESHRLVLAVGASIPHAELVLPMASRASDAAWRARIAAEGDAPPGPLETSFFVKP